MRIGADPVDIGGKARTVARRERIERRNVRFAVHRQNEVPAVGKHNRRRRRAVCERKSAFFQFRPKFGESRRRDEQHERRRHHVVDETRRRYFLGADAAADTVIALKNKNLAPLAAEHRGRNECIDPASDNDVVGGSHFAPAGL